jgi:integrase/recombinase XerD
MTTPTATNQSTPDALKAWLDQLAANGKARNTIDSYRGDVRHFLAHLADRGITHPTTADVDAYLDQAGMADSTKARRYASLAGFYGYMAAQGLAATNPVADARRPGWAPPASTSVPAVADVRRVVERAPEGSRERAVLELLAAGLAPAEIVALAIADLDLDEGRLDVKGRGGARRTIEVPPQAVDALARYIRHGRADYNKGSVRNSHHAFLNTAGRPMDRGTVWKIVQQAATGAGVGAMSPHDMRSARFVALLMEGHDLATVARLAGHRHPSAARRYELLRQRRASA